MDASLPEVDRLDRIRGLLVDAGAAGLLVVGRSGADPDLATFVGSSHLGDCLVVLPTAGEPHLAYTTDMERAEAAATGLKLLTPSRLRSTSSESNHSAESNGRPESNRREASDRTYRLWSAALRECDIESGRIAVAGTYPAGLSSVAIQRLLGAGFEILDFNQAMRLARKTKTELEKEEISRVAGVTCAAMRATAEALASCHAVEGGVLYLDDAPLTAGCLRRSIRLLFAEAGLEQPEGNIVSAGPDAAIPHTQGRDDRELRDSESIVVDLYPKGRMFADCTRTFCVGSPPPRLAKAHCLVMESLRAATQAAQPGSAGSSLQATVCEIFEAAGWETPLSTPGTTRGYVHGLGHGVGFELHELPAFKSSPPEGDLEVGDVFTLEPGLYDPQEGFGVRVEDLLWLGESGVECLTPLPYELDPASW